MNKALIRGNHRRVLPVGILITLMTGSIEIQATVGESDLFSFDTRDDLTSLVVESPAFAFDTRQVDGLSGTEATVTFTLDTRDISATGLSIVGPSVCPSASSASFQALLQQTNRSFLDVTTQATWSATGAPIQAMGEARSGISNGKLVTGLLTPADPVVKITATYRYPGGQMRSAVHEVTIGTGNAIGVGMTNPGVSYLQPVGPDFQWRVTSTAYGEAMQTAGTTLQWFWDGQLLGTGGSFDEQFITQPSTHTLKLVATTPSGLTGVDERRVIMTRPSANEPGQRFPALAMQGAKFLNSSGASFQFAAARKQHGLVLLVHGMADGPNSDWICMANAISERMGGLGKIPNIVIYGWEEEADPSLYYLNLSDPGFTDRLIKGYGDLLSNSGGPIGEFIMDLQNVRPHGQAQGVRLNSWIRSEIGRGNIDPTKPIHFIGHSAGGFAIGEAAYLLKQPPNPIHVSTVTMLDTPFPIWNHLTKLPDPTKVELYVSSFYGTLAWPIGNSAHLRRKDLFSPFLLGVAYNADYYHSYSRAWYYDTVLQLKDSDDGFNRSPLLTEGSASETIASFANGAANPESREILGPSDATPLSGFTTFGNVTGVGAGYSLAEDTNAGIQEAMTLPIGAETLRFDYRFTGGGDGEFVVVYFGDNPPLFIAPNIQPEAAENRTAEVSLAGYEGQNGTLVIKLVAQGDATAIAILENIELVVTDDPDQDGLTTAEETAIGTNPLSMDTDGDRLDDLFEITSMPPISPLLPDSDFDGAGDYSELLAGTHPVDAGSRFQVVQAQRTSGGFLLRWSGVAGRTYQVQRSDHPGFGSFTTVASGIAGVAPLTNYTDNSLGAPIPTRLFYRVQVEE